MQGCLLASVAPTTHDTTTFLIVFSRSYTRIPHLGGRPGSHQIADEIEEKWREFGLDLVEQTTYNVLLSYPDEDNPNLIKLYHNDSLEFTSADNEIIPGENNTGVVQPYNSYAPSGTFTVRFG